MIDQTVQEKIPYTLNIGGKICNFSTPMIMAILNITPDSFYMASRIHLNEIETKANKMVEQGAMILDLGGYSTRPGNQVITLEDEWKRLKPALNIIRQQLPNTILSIDTFQSEIVRRANENFGPMIINDISGGQGDEKMFSTIADLKLPYIIGHLQGDISTMHQQVEYKNLIADLLLFFSKKIDLLKQQGVCNLLIDPGFGFSKNMEQNYHLMAHLNQLQTLNSPVVVGISRKSMIWKKLNITPAESLNGTTILHTMALMGGANIIRVHDVEEARQVVTLVETLKQNR